MEGKYIFAIVVLGLFFLLIFVSFAFIEYERLKESKLQAWIDEQYDSKEVKKYDYDAADEDELISAEDTADIDEVTDPVAVAEDTPVDDTYGKIDVEGIEEITGNYNGDK